jgi:hypothetical protein
LVESLTKARFFLIGTECEQSVGFGENFGGAKVTWAKSGKVWVIYGES